jgi:hypothetical protein
MIVKMKMCNIASIAPTASSSTFTWEDMTNTTNRKEGQANKVVCSVL